jgi:hypothetical protein
MPLRTLLLIAGLIALAFGLGFLLMPRPVLALYGVMADPTVVLIARFFGAELVQIGLVLYLVRDVGDPRTQGSSSLPFGHRPPRKSSIALKVCSGRS